ncbi:MAG: arsenate reductase ArsC [Thermoplasmatota archaeon]
MKTVLFLCTHNSARSQMAEGLMKKKYGDRIEVASAGTQPSKVHPLAIECMKEIGIDISSQRSKSVEEFIDEKIDLVVTVCDNAKENCPLFPGAKEYIHKGFQDPSAFVGPEVDQLGLFRKIRDDIADWMDTDLAPVLGLGKHSSSH